MRTAVKLEGLIGLGVGLTLTNTILIIGLIVVAMG